MTEEQPKNPWTMERIHQEIYNARTTAFVITKVLETGNIKPAEHPEWTLVIKPLLADLRKLTDRIGELMEGAQPQE